MPNSVAEELVAYTTEAKFSTEVGHTARGMKRDIANEIVKHLLNAYESKAPEAPVAKCFQDPFNIETLEPKSEYVELYERMKEELKEYDLRFIA